MDCEYSVNVLALKIVNNKIEMKHKLSIRKPMKHFALNGYGWSDRLGVTPTVAKFFYVNWRIEDSWRFCCSALLFEIFHLLQEKFSFVRPLIRLCECELISKLTSDWLRGQLSSIDILWENSIVWLNRRQILELNCRRKLFWHVLIKWLKSHVHTILHEKEAAQSTWTAVHFLLTFEHARWSLLDVNYDKWHGNHVHVARVRARSLLCLALASGSQRFRWYFSKLCQYCWLNDSFQNFVLRLFLIFSPIFFYFANLWMRIFLFIFKFFYTNGKCCLQVTIVNY